MLFTGLAIGIPLIFFASRLVCTLTGQYPVLVYIGAGILGILGGKMIITDGIVVRTFHPDPLTQRFIPFASVVAILIAGRLLRARSNCQEYASTFNAHPAARVNTTQP